LRGPGAQKVMEQNTGEQKRPRKLGRGEVSKGGSGNLPGGMPYEKKRGAARLSGTESLVRSG